jgi:glycosyltransferase involved in cell wall biosynthesis
MAKMRVLMVSEAIPHLPSHDGFRLIPANLIRHLSERHEIYLIALSHGGESDEEVEWPHQYCKAVSITRVSRNVRGRLRGITGTVDSALMYLVSDMIAKLRPDVLHLEGGGLSALLQTTARRLPGILCVHDSKALRYQEFAAYSTSVREWIRLKLLSTIARRQELRWFGNADRVVVTSPSDAQALSTALLKARIAVIPNGVDLGYFAFRPTPEEGRIVFTGNMSWPPNEDAAEHFARDLMPAIQRRIPNASFWIVGAQPSPRVQSLASIPGIQVTGTVNDIRPWIRSAAVYASPLRFGFGVKNKILEAMASGAPIVATSRSLSGTPLINGRDAMVADDDAKFAEAVVRLLSDAELRNSISREARRRAEAEYSWDSITAEFEELYREIVTGRQAPDRFRPFHLTG